MRPAKKSSFVLAVLAFIVLGMVASAYVLLSPPRKWFAADLPRNFIVCMQTGENSLASSAASAANTAAVATWNAAMQGGTTFTSSVSNSTGNIGFVNDGLSTISFEDPQNVLSGGTLAAATVGYYTTSQTTTTNGVTFYRYYDSDVVYNNNVDFTTLGVATASPSIGCLPAEYDMEGIAVQEVGHSLGLDHPSIEQASMYGSLSAADFRKTDLDDDDINGMRSIYIEGYSSVNFPAGTSLRYRNMIFGPSTKTIKPNTKAYVYIYIVDENKNSVSGVTVSVSISYPSGSSGSVSATTGSTGRVVFNMGTFTAGNPGYTVTITNLSKSGYTFTAANNPPKTHVFTTN